METIRVYSVNYKSQAKLIGEDTLANFNAVRDMTYASPTKLDPDRFGIYGHDEHLFLAYVVR